METAKPRQSLTGIVRPPGGRADGVPLVAGPALRASARPQFEQALMAIGSLLGCPARPAD